MRMLRWFRFQRDGSTTAPDQGAVVVGDPIIDDLFGEFWNVSLEDLKTPDDWRHEAEHAYSSGFRAACRDLGVDYEVEYVHVPKGVLFRYKAKVPE